MEERTGPLTWGQYLPWVTQNAAPESNTYFKILIFDVIAPSGVSTDTALRVLDEMVAKHEGLRTTFEPTEGAVRQVVHPMRERGYQCVVSDAVPPPDTIEWLDEPFDLAREWPLRAAVWRRADGRCVLRLAVNRMILDHEGMIVVRSYFRRAFRAGSIEFEGDRAEPAAWEPIDIAEFERSPAGRRRDERAYAYWRRTLMTAPASLFTTARPGRPTDSRFTISLVRAGLRPIVRELAAAFRVTEPIILTATGLLALSWVGGWPSVCATIVSNNRSHREMRTSLSPMLDRSLVNVVVDPTRAFSAWAGKLGAAVIGAYQHSHADPNTLLRAYADVSMERGIFLDRLPILNIMVGPFAVAGRAAQAPPALGRAIRPLPADEYETKVLPRPLDGVYVRARLEWRRVSVELIAGEEVFDLPTGERVVALFPSILESLAAHGDLTLGKLAEVAFDAPAGTGPSQVVHVDHTRVDLAVLRALLRECDGVADCAVFTRTGEDGALRLHACVAGDERIHDLHALRRAVIGRLPAHRQALCPHWFRVVRTAPEQRDSYAAWSEVPAVAEGSGWPAPASPSARLVEAALAKALAAAHPPMSVDLVDLGLPYCLANGRFERIPEFLAELAGRGIEGISVDDLMGTQPLVNLLNAGGRTGCPSSSDGTTSPEPAP